MATVSELKDVLNERGVEYSSTALKADLELLVEEPPGVLKMKDGSTIKVKSNSQDPVRSAVEEVFVDLNAQGTA